jgi:hypothetical protein
MQCPDGALRPRPGTAPRIPGRATQRLRHLAASLPARRRCTPERRLAGQVSCCVACQGRCRRPDPPTSADRPAETESTVGKARSTGVPCPPPHRRIRSEQREVAGDLTARGRARPVPAPPVCSAAGPADSCGGACRHRCSARGQRGWNRQPGGMSSTAGTVPGIAASVRTGPSTVGTERSSASVYGAPEVIMPAEPASREMPRTGPLSPRGVSRMSRRRNGLINPQAGSRSPCVTGNAAPAR